MNHALAHIERERAQLSGPTRPTAPTTERQELYRKRRQDYLTAACPRRSTSTLVWSARRR